MADRIVFVSGLLVRSIQASAIPSRKAAVAEWQGKASEIRWLLGALDGSLLSLSAAADMEPVAQEKTPEKPLTDLTSLIDSWGSNFTVVQVKRMDRIYGAGLICERCGHVGLQALECRGNGGYRAAYVCRECGQARSSITFPICAEEVL